MADRDVEGLLRWSLACMALASAVIHASAAADHQGLPLHVAFFLVVAGVQSGLAAAVLRGRSGRWVAATAGFNGAVAVIWLLSRTVGLPVEGAAAAEAIGFKDGISTLLELGIVAGAGLLAALPEAGRRIALSTGPLASVVIAASAWGLGVSGLLAHHTHDEHVHLHGGEVQAVAEHHGTADHRAADHQAADHHAAARASSVDDSGLRGHSHPTDVVDLSEAHDHGHRAFAPGGGPAAGHRHTATAEAVTADGPAPHHARAHREHEPDGAVPDDGTCGGGHKHEPEHHPGAGGQEHDPGDDTSPAGPLIDDVMRLLEPD
ncbi:MAG: hypothetical protein QOE80_174 [Actinomycetota bacterium]|nr:hypothetical protein [Actinomycetota bacterium]